MSSLIQHDLYCQIFKEIKSFQKRGLPLFCRSEQIAFTLLFEAYCTRPKGYILCTYLIWHVILMIRIIENILCFSKVQVSAIKKSWQFDAKASKGGLARNFLAAAHYSRSSSSTGALIYTIKNCLLQGKMVKCDYIILKNGILK